MSGAERETMVRAPAVPPEIHAVSVALIGSTVDFATWSRLAASGLIRR